MSNAANSQAQAGDPSQEGANAPQYVTEEQLGKIVGNIVNSAVTSQLGRALPKALEVAIAGAIEPLKSKLAETPPPTERERKAEQSPEFAALQKQLGELQSQLKAKEEEALAERKRAREDRALSDLKASLVGKVTPGSEDVLATYLHAKGAIAIDGEGNVNMRVRTSLYSGQPEADHEFPLKDGIEHYLKTKEASPFIPAPNNGAGGNARRLPTNPSTRDPVVNGELTGDAKAVAVAEQLRGMGINF